MDTDSERAQKEQALYAAMTDFTAPPAKRLQAGEALEALGWTPPDLDEFVPIQVEGKVTFWMGKYPVTNLQYARFIAAPDYADEALWHSVSGFGRKGQPLKDIGAEAWKWFGEQGGQACRPKYWADARFGVSRRLLPVARVTWYEAAAYCAWLTRHWKEILPSNGLPENIVFRLPLKAEWVTAAGGEEGNRYPWQKTPGEIIGERVGAYANTAESNSGGTTPVCMYPAGQSPQGVMDMAGNVWEWQADEVMNSWHELLGGSWSNRADSAHVAFRLSDLRHIFWDYSYGFRVAGVTPTTL